MNPTKGHFDFDGDDVVIDLSRSFDRIYWKRRLGTSEEELKAAVDAVGSKVSDVQQFLAGQRNQSAA